MRPARSGAGSKSAAPPRLALAGQPDERHRLGGEIIDQARRSRHRRARGRRCRAASPGRSARISAAAAAARCRRSRRSPLPHPRCRPPSRVCRSRFRSRSRQSPEAGRRISGLIAPLALRTVPNVPPLPAPSGGEERQEAVAGLVDPPVAQHDRHVGVVGLALVAFDDQHAGHAAPELLGGVAMRCGRRTCRCRAARSCRRILRPATPAAASDMGRRPGRSAGGCRASGWRCARPRAADGSRASHRAAGRASAAPPAAMRRRRTSRAAASCRRSRGALSAARRQRGQVRPRRCHGVGGRRQLARVGAAAETRDGGCSKGSSAADETAAARRS